MLNHLIRQLFSLAIVNNGMNFDNRSIAFNDEANLTVRDSLVTSQHNAQFLDDLRHSNEFKADLFSRRSLREKAIDFAASRIAKLL